MCNSCQCLKRFTPKPPPRPKLYYDDVSPKARSVLMLIKKLNLDVELKFINTLRSEHMTQEYRDINPGNTVPTLVDRGLVLFSSPAIQIYLVCKYGKDSDLYPSTCDDQMNVLNLLFFDISVLYRRHGTCVVEMIRQGGADSVKEFYGERVLDCYKALEELLTKHCYMALNVITIADYAVIGTITGLDILYPLEEHAKDMPNLQRWYKEMSCLPEFEEMISGIDRERSAIKKFTDRRELQSLISQDLANEANEEDEMEEDEEEDELFDDSVFDGMERVCRCDYDPENAPPPTKDMIYDTRTPSEQFLELQQRLGRQQQQQHQHQHGPSCCCCECEKERERERELQSLRSHEVRPSPALSRINETGSRLPEPPHEPTCCCCECELAKEREREREREREKREQKLRCHEVRPAQASSRLNQGVKCTAPCAQPPPPPPPQEEEHPVNCCCCVCKRVAQREQQREQRRREEREKQREREREKRRQQQQRQQQQQYQSYDQMDELVDHLEDFEKRPIQSQRRTALDPQRISQLEELQHQLFDVPKRQPETPQRRLSQAPQPRPSYTAPQPRPSLAPQPRLSQAPPPRSRPSSAAPQRQTRQKQSTDRYDRCCDAAPLPYDRPYDRCAELYAECLEENKSTSKSKASLQSDECCCCRCSSAVNSVERIYTPPKPPARSPQRLPSKAALPKKQQQPYYPASFASSTTDPCAIFENENSRKVAAFERSLATSCLKTPDKSCAGKDTCPCSDLAAPYIQPKPCLDDKESCAVDCRPSELQNQYSELTHDDADDDCCCCACKANKENLKHYKGQDGGSQDLSSHTPRNSSSTDSTRPKIQKSKSSVLKQIQMSQTPTKQQLSYSQESFERAKANSCLGKNLGCGGTEDCPCSEIAARYEAKLQAQREEWLKRAAADDEEDHTCACCQCKEDAKQQKDALSSDQEPQDDDELDEDEHEEELVQHVSQKSVVSKRPIARKSNISVKKSHPAEDYEEDDEDLETAPRRISATKRALVRKSAKTVATGISKSGVKSAVGSQQLLSDIMPPKRLSPSSSKSKGTKMVEKEKPPRKNRLSSVSKGSRDLSATSKSMDIKIKPRSSSVPRSSEKRRDCERYETSCCPDPKCDCWQEKPQREGEGSGSRSRSQTPTAKSRKSSTAAAPPPAKAPPKSKRASNPCCKCHAVDAYYDDGNCHCDLQLPSHSVPLQKRRSAGQVVSGSDSDDDEKKRIPCRPPNDPNVRVPCGTCHCFKRICLCTHCVEAMQNRLDESFYWYLDQPNTYFPQNFPKTKDCQFTCPPSSGKKQEIITPTTLRANLQAKFQKAAKIAATSTSKKPSGVPNANPQ